MTLELRSSGKGRRHQGHPIVAALPRTRMTRMVGAVIDHLDGLRRERLLESGTDLADGGFTRTGYLAGSKGRVS